MILRSLVPSVVLILMCSQRAPAQIIVDEPGWAWEVFSETAANPTRMDVDSNGNIYCANSSEEGRITKIDPQGQGVSFGPMMTDPDGMLVGPDDMIYVGDTAGVMVISPGGYYSRWLAGMDNVNAMCWDRDFEHMWVVEKNTRFIHKVRFEGAQIVQSIETGWSDIYDSVEEDLDGNLYSSGPCSLGNAVVRFAANGSIAACYEYEPQGALRIGSWRDANKLLIVHTHEGVVLTLNLLTGEFSSFARGFSSPKDAFWHDDGCIYVTDDATDLIYRFYPTVEADEEGKPCKSALTLAQNIPNPWLPGRNRCTRIFYSIPKSLNVELVVSDLN